MKDFETKTERTQRVMKELLFVLGMNITELSVATGVNYMVLYNASSGRKKQLDDETINAICGRFPHISRSYLIYGTGEILEQPQQVIVQDEKQTVSADDIQKILERATMLLDKVLAREDIIDMKLREIMERERKLTEREIALQNKEIS